MSPFTLSLIISLTIGQCGWHIVSTYLWEKHIKEFQAILINNTGLLSFDEANKIYSEQTGFTLNEMTWAWTNPTMSLLLSPHGVVKTIIANPTYITWEPFNPQNPENINSHYFDIGEYKRHYREQ